MSSLTPIEKRRLERLFDMGGGYVLDFSNRTFHEFFLDTLGRDIYDTKYDYESGSKANRLRQFWKVEPDHVVAAALSSLIEYATDLGAEESLVKPAEAIRDRLLQGATVADLEAISSSTEDKSFEAAAESARRSIADGTPEVGLDRLHTFTVKFLRVLCTQHGIDTPQSKPIHGLLGQLIKKFKSEGKIETRMTERILKSSISLLEAFNDVRNNRSLAHDNELISHDEALLIFNSVCSVIRFVRHVDRQDDEGGDVAEVAEVDIPF